MRFEQIAQLLVDRYGADGRANAAAWIVPKRTVLAQLAVSGLAEGKASSRSYVSLFSFLLGKCMVVSKAALGAKAAIPSRKVPALH